ncbi:MAG: hypothetical protein QM765_42940 [Myxococcales bacterium]
MKKRDAVRTLAMMIGTSVCYVGLRAAGFESHWGRLIVAVLLGIGIGWASESLYSANRKPPAPRS